ncbi:hypothetical protein BH09ACT1_BH09ACT1_18210 [soil metagenome]
MTILHSRIGIEIELIAPPGSSRRDLADRLSADHRGTVTRMFHTDSEPSLVPGMGHFWHLTPGFSVVDDSGRLLALLVDDVTLIADLHREHEAARATATTLLPHLDEHQYRILSDDPRLLRLVARHTHADTPFDRVLDDVAALFGSTVERVGAVRRLRDPYGASIALATGVAIGRERPCEIVTPPLDADHEAALEDLLRPARELGFTVPEESAVHLHFDGAPFRSAAAFRNLVRLFGWWRAPLRDALATNPSCTRLAPLPDALLELVEQPDAARSGQSDEWPRLQAAASSTGLTKYFDVNLTALLTDEPTRDTVEVRILPGSLVAAEITSRASLVERLLARCLEPTPILPPTSTDPADAAIELRSLAATQPTGTFIPLAENRRVSGR